MTNQNQSLQTIPEDSVVPADVSAGALQSALNGDLAKLSGEDRLKFYGKLCEFTGLNPLSKPFDWIQFQGKLTLYPNKGCAEQLRKLHGITFDDRFDRQLEFGVMTMTVRGQDQRGRRDFATAALPFDDKMPADARAIAIMKLETKAKRRLTLSICGLTMFARDAEDQEPEGGEVSTRMPETTTDRAKLLQDAIELEPISDTRPAVGLKPPSVQDQEHASGASDKQRVGGVSTATPATVPTAAGANLSAGSPARDEGQPAQVEPKPEPASTTLPKPVTAPPTGAVEQAGQTPQASAPSASPATTAGDNFADPDGRLTDDTVQKIETILSQGGAIKPEVAVRWIIFKGQLKAVDGRFDLANLNHQCANWLLRKPDAIWKAVNDWVKTGGDK